jgi:hypothetical protein
METESWPLSLPSVWEVVGGSSHALSIAQAQHFYEKRGPGNPFTVPDDLHVFRTNDQVALAAGRCYYRLGGHLIGPTNLEKGQSRIARTPFVRNSGGTQNAVREVTLQVRKGDSIFLV